MRHREGCTSIHTTDDCEDVANGICREASHPDTTHRHYEHPAALGRNIDLGVDFDKAPDTPRFDPTGANWRNGTPGQDTGGEHLNEVPLANPWPSLDPELTRQAIAEAFAQLKKSMDTSMEEFARRMGTFGSEVKRYADNAARPTPAGLHARVREWKGTVADTFVDTTGAYGPQSPDLISHYIQHVFAVPGWQFPEVYAGQFLDTDSVVIRSLFHQIGPEECGRVGDIVVLSSHDGVGNVGVITTEWLDRGDPVVRLFAQSPIYPAGETEFPGHRVLGGFRPKVRAF